MKAITTETGYLFIGTAREICSLYKNFMRREIAIPAFCNFPKFNMSKYYGLSVDIYDEWNEMEIAPKMQIVAGDTALAIIYDLKAE